MNPADEVSVKRVLNVPKRGVGDSSVGRLDAWARGHGLSFVEALREAAAAGVTGRALKGIDEFLALLDEVGPLAAGGPATLIEVVMQRSGYVAELESERSIEAEGRIENIAELVGVARGFESTDEFLEQVGLVADVDSLSAEDSAVVLMTLHSAKGLEFPNVFLIGLEDGIFPHMRSIGDPDELEEERRLAYVGLTRARERLFLTHAWARMIHGATQYNPPSRFFEEIPADLVQVVDGSRHRTRQSSGHGPGTDPRPSGRGTFSRDAGSAGSMWGSSWSASERRRREDDDWTGHVIGGRSGRSGDSPRSTPSQPAPPRPSGADRLGLAVGDDVHHGSFGDGVITAIEGTGDKAEAVVHFAGVGEKRLLLAWAPLEKR